MKKQLGILLLIFIAAVGLSSAVAAQPVTQGAAQGSQIIPRVSQGHVVTPRVAQRPIARHRVVGRPIARHRARFWHWTIVRRFVVSSRFNLNRLRFTFRPPTYRITVARLGSHRLLVTVWRRSFGPVYRGTAIRPGPIRR